jgi:CRP-like cAMP-binding protein
LISLDNAILASANLQTTNLSYSAGDIVFERGAPAQFVYVVSTGALCRLGHCPEVAAQSCSFFSQGMALVTSQVTTTATLFRL